MKKLQKIAHWRIMEETGQPSKSMAEMHLASLIHFRRVTPETPVLHENHTGGEWIKAKDCRYLDRVFFEEGIYVARRPERRRPSAKSMIISLLIILAMISIALWAFYR